MNDERDERGLRDLFARQRADESARTPPFAQTVAAARRRGRRAGVPRTIWVLGAASAAAAIVMAMVLIPGGTRTGPRQVTADLSSVGWRSPTDFLLETPGAELMRTTPRVVRLEDMTLPALGGGDKRGKQR